MFLLACFGASGCPHGLEYFYNQKFVMQLRANNYTYFYTNTPRSTKLALQMRIKTEKPVEFAAERSFICPNRTTPVFATLPGGDDWYLVETYFKDPTMLMIAIGIWSDEEQMLQGELLHQENRKYAKPIVVKLVAILVTMTTTVLLFFYFYELPQFVKKTTKIE